MKNPTNIKHNLDYRANCFQHSHTGHDFYIRFFFVACSFKGDSLKTAEKNESLCLLLIKIK